MDKLKILTKQAGPEPESISLRLGLRLKISLVSLKRCGYFMQVYHDCEMKLIPALSGADGEDIIKFPVR